MRQFFLDVPVLNCRNKNYPESPVYIFVVLTSYNVVVLHIPLFFAISSVLYLAVMSAFLAFISFISVSSSRSWDLIKSSSFRLNVLFTVTWKEKTLKDIVYVMYNECFSLNSRKLLWDYDIGHQCIPSNAVTWLKYSRDDVKYKTINLTP